MEGFLVVFLVLFRVQTSTSSHCTMQVINKDTIVTCRDLPSIITSLPASLPDNVTWLDISHNAISEIQVMAMSRFNRIRFLDLSFNDLDTIAMGLFENWPDLQVLNISNNHLRSLELMSVSNDAKYFQGNFWEGTTLTTSNYRSVFTFQKNLRYLDLNNNRINFISPQTFDGLGSLRVLKISNNNISTIVNDSFRQMSELEELDISTNNLQNLEPGSFNGLRKLKMLSLFSNRLRYDYTALPPGLFESVGESLTTLNLKKNSFYDGELVYPERTLSKLRSLEHLSIGNDGNVPFGEGFAEMHNLRTLDLSSDCQMYMLYNDTFASFKDSHLETLDLSSCRIYGVEICTFCPLKHLTSVSLRWNRHLPLYQALRSLYGLQDHNMTQVDFSQTKGPSFFGGSELDEHSTEFLLNTCISTLDLNSNFITGIKSNALVRKGSRFNKCIKNLDLSSNMISGLSVLTIFIFFREFVLLESFKMQNQILYNINDVNTPHHFLTRYTTVYHSFWMIIVSEHLYLISFSGNDKQNVALPDVVQFRNAKSLKFLDLSYFGIVGCRSHLVGLENLQVLNVSGNNCYVLSLDFLDSLTGLTELSARSMDFDPILIPAQGHRLFSNLSHLQRLDLSDNNFEYMPSDFLSSQSNMQEIILSQNRFQRLPVEMIAHMNLTLLDMTDNALSRLQDNEQRALDEMAERSTGHFHLSLHGNPIVCTCETLYFVRWLSETKVILDDSGNYTCVTGNGGLSSTRQVAENWMYVWRQCVGLEVLWWSMASLLLLFIVIGSTWGVVVNYTRVRFLLTVFWRLKMPRREQFTKDAYLAYSNRDWELACVQLKRVLEDQRGVRLLIKDLPIDAPGTQFYQLPGDNECEKILEHIDMCWKVVLVVTDALSRDPMSGFMVRAVLQSISDLMPERVVVVVVGTGGIPEVASLKTLLESVPEKNVFYVTQTMADSHEVWNNMARVILE